jgi:hypothetical protein
LFEGLKSSRCCIAKVYIGNVGRENGWIVG